jgi:hypothetical protein
MRVLLSLLFLALAGCSTVWDPHAPSTIVAPETGGEVTVKHGQRLQVKLPAAGEGMEWRTREPMTTVVLAEAAPERDGRRMTPVRSGKETLRFEEVPERGAGAAQRAVSYEVTVP